MCGRQWSASQSRFDRASNESHTRRTALPDHVQLGPTGNTRTDVGCRERTVKRKTYKNIGCSRSKYCNVCLCRRFTHLVVDVVSVDDVTTFDVIFGATLEGNIEKRITLGEGSQSCLVERIALTRRGDVTRVTSMQLMTSRAGERLLLVSTEEEVLRLPVARCERFRTQQ